MDDKLIVAGVSTEFIDDNCLISTEDNTSIIPFYTEEKYILDNVNFTKFVKNVEMQIRTSLEYKSYIRYLKEELHLNRCMVYGHITDEVAPIEMHHHILTLYDIVEIIIGWCFKNKMIFSSSKIFSIVMEEHRLNNILVIMLSQMVHVAVHNKNKDDGVRFLDYRMGHGNICEFLNKYYTGLSFTHLSKIRKYMEDFNKNSKEPAENFFEEIITKWNKEVMIQ